MSPLFRLTVQQLTGKWRIVIMAILASLPVAFTALIVNAPRPPFVDEFEVIVISTLLAGSIAPLIIVAIASVAFGNEVDDRTLANLTLSPLPRWQIVLPKMVGALAVAGPFILGSAFTTGFLAYNRDGLAVASLMIGTGAGLMMYTSFFVWLGLVTKQAIGVGLLYIVLWEGFFAGFVEGIRYLSIRQYAIALMNGIDPRRFATEVHVAPMAAWIVAGGICSVFFVLTTRRLRRMDVP